ncbi:Zn-dependent hydrolase [Aidingimonas halophila]|uniref:N-carbamoyl-L-amino-acid hydrolase n=1 Tax=Aidingimonas halophila TaxID=574349 RepID=A0A1H3CW73_9GAMM|nr:Zn-dependent hydrolase [Aidingimonas halophila]GHC30945.1 Zn-dependent hydrolase [Aidingimonas halophila]SDX58375.1 N-carbamoyl-L-amino-acid hydrolase [Aidingimonas halophila]
MHRPVTIDSERLWHRLERLATFTDPDRPWTRRAFTDRYLEARAWLRREMEQAGLTTRLDDAANLIGTLPGSQPDLAPIAVGSHIDTVVGGGRYDGTLGVLAGLEAVQSLREAGITLTHSVEVIDFLSEEPSDYGVSCIGSRAMTGALSSAMLDFREPGGETLRDAIRRMGGIPEALGTTLRRSGDLSAFIELHIEQGRVLEQQDVPIGVVSDIVGIRRYDIVINGQADHAGTTPMALRRDALAEAASLIQRIQHDAETQAKGDDYLVATVGRLEVSPNAANAIPDTVTMVLEIRSDNAALLEGFFTPIAEHAMARATQRGLSIDCTPLSEGLPTHCAPRIQAHIQQAANHLGLQTLSMPSGAGHDAVYMADITPTGMLFVPCRDGRSHCPEEDMTPRQAADGCQVIAETLRRLDLERYRD